MAANGNTGNSTGQSAASAQQTAAASNAAASNAANGNTGTGNTSTSNTSGGESTGKGNAGSTNTSTNTSTSNNATNSAGLMGSLIGFGNAVAKGEVGNGGGGGSDSKSDDGKSDALAQALRQDKIVHTIQNIFTSAEKARGRMPSYVVEAGDKAYTKARAMGKTEAEAQAIARNTVDKALSADTPQSSLRHAFVTLGEGIGPRNADAAAFEGKNTGPTYNPSITAQANTNKNIAKGSSEMGPSTPATTPATAPATTPATTPTANNAPGGNLGGETGGIVSGAAPTNVSDATNTGVTNRGGTVANGGTSVTDSGTGGSISSSVTPPSRDASSIGLGVYDNDRANYDQDNWNRGMEVESSSLVSDEECKAFAKRAFMENSEPFRKVRISIVKKC